MKKMNKFGMLLTGTAAVAALVWIAAFFTAGKLSESENRLPQEPESAAVSEIHEAVPPVEPPFQKPVPVQQEEPVPAGYTGWRKWLDGSWSYFKKGQLTSGWLLDNGKWYFLDGEGIMKTGWFWQQGWYYFTPSGAMQTGWLLDHGKWYFCDSSGKMCTGYLHDGKDWYYLNGSGEWLEGYTDAEITSGGRQICIVDGVAYVDGILIANKRYPLPRDYAPGKLTAEVEAALAKMQQAAARDGLNLFVVSGYRSYDYQAQLYRNYCKRDGQAAADRYSARPGYSEHQTGLAFDLNSTSNSFARTPEAAWLAKHAQEYGFIIRYPKGKEKITGYQYEPWHLRYLGAETAKAVFESGLCLEEYLGISSDYLN